MKTVLSPTQLENLGYFNFKQCIRSPIAQKNNIKNFPGSDFTHQYPDPKLTKDNIIINLHRLFKYCINPIFRQFRSNLGLTSVYRNKEVNKILGGVENSQHIYGYAADIVLTDGTPSSTLFNWCRINIPEYHQLIWEYPERGDHTGNTNDFSWVHISYIKGDNNKINSLSSTNSDIHNAYKDENTFYINDYTHRIELANQNILE
jgi:zinc D-Ala-D-Ala carboxypeptidase